MLEKRGIKNVIFLFIILIVISSFVIAAGTEERRQEVIDLLKKGVVENKESPISIWMISLFVAIVIIGYVNYKLLKKHKRVDYKPMIKKTPMQVLDNFIIKAIAKGHNVEDIKIMLMHKGWSKDLVEKALESIR